MKKILLYLLPVLLVACSGGDSNPIIRIEKLYINEDQENNYAKEESDIPALKKGDRITTVLVLDGNGADLKTFLLKTSGKIEYKMHYEKSEVSSDENLTDDKHGRLRFLDGVSSTQLIVEAAVTDVDKEGNVKLSFYLSSKAECDGAQETIQLTVDDGR